MKSIDNYNNNDFISKKEKSKDINIGSPEAWLNENGRPNYEYLQSLATHKTPENLEQLRLIADDLNVDYHSTLPAQELVDRIRLTLSQDDSE